MDQSDQELIQQIQAQDTNAFAVFFDRYRELIYRHVMSMVRDTVVTEDIVQEVFLRVWTRAEQWDHRGAVKPWLYRIATNLALNQLRTQRRRPQQPLEAKTLNEGGEEEEISVPGWMIDATALEPATRLEAAEQTQRLQQLVNQLSDDKREIFRLVYDAEMDLRSVADQLGIPEGTVKSRLYYSKKQLARAWQAEEF